MSKAAPLAATVWLALLGIAAATIGVHDAVAATEISVRVVGSLLLGGGIVMLAGAVGLWQRKPVGLSLAMIAALVGVVIGIMAFLTQVANDEPDRRLVAWTLIIVASGTAALCIRRLTPPEERARGIWSRLPILKSAISIGVLFSIAQFWYSQIYVPTTAPPSLTLETSIDKITPRGSHLVIEGAVTIRNTSNTAVQVLASAFTVVGERYAPGDATAEDFADYVSDADLGKIAVVDRHIGLEESTLVSRGRLEPVEWFEAAETITVPILTWVPKRRYNALRISAGMTVGRRNALGRLEDQVDLGPFPMPVDGGVVFLTRLPEAGWLRRLTRGARYLRVKYSRDPEEETALDPLPEVGFASKRESDPPESFKRRLRAFYKSQELLPPENFEQWLPVLHGVGLPDPPEGYDRRLSRYYGVASLLNRAVVSLPVTPESFH